MYFLLLSLLVSIGLSSAQNCTGPFEEYNSCGTHCPVTCSNNQTDTNCIQSCKSGCFCVSGYIRNDQGTCVRPENCPKNCTDVNSKYVACLACKPTCANYIRNESEIICAQVCIAGCECNTGYLKNDQGICVLPANCPASSGSGQCTNPNEIYKTCGTACELTCKNYQNSPILCAQVCKGGCSCNSPYVRDESTGKCVLKANCPKVTLISILLDFLASIVNIFQIKF